MNIKTEAAINFERLHSAFREIGLGSGDSIIVHSSCRSLGPVEGGADTVIDALLAAIGSRGNLMLPTFNYTKPLPTPYYDPAETPGRTGVITELGRRRKGAIRSLHPTHSVAVIGPDAAPLTESHHERRAFGIDSPIDRLAEINGKILLLGVGQISNSTIHIAEEHAGIPKYSAYDPLPHVKVRTAAGTTLEVQLDTSPSCSVAFGAAESTMREHGLIADLRLNGCLLQLMSGQEVIRRIKTLLQARPDHLLCTWSKCIPCTKTRTQLTRKSQ